MRITQNSVVSKTIAQVQERFQRLAELQQQITTGLLLNRPSDDPNRAGHIINATSVLNRDSRYLKNAQILQQELQATDTAVSQVSDLVSRVRASALQGANGGINASDRYALAREVDGELSELLRIADQRYGSKYLFGGSNANQSPFTIEKDVNGKIISVAASDPEAMKPTELTIEEGVRMSTSIPAGDLFNLPDGTDLFQLLINTRNALDGNDKDAITASLDTLQDAVDMSSSASTLIGTRLRSTQTILDRLTATKSNSEERLSSLADADAVDVISRYNQEQAAYETSLRATARIIQPSLVNFV